MRKNKSKGVKCPICKLTVYPCKDAFYSTPEEHIKWCGRDNSGLRRFQIIPGTKT